jgi:hypothetical protein
VARGNRALADADARIDMAPNLSHARATILTADDLRWQLVGDSPWPDAKPARAGDSARVNSPDICWTMTGSAPWPPSQPILDAAMTGIPLISDPVIAELVEQLALTVSDQRAELKSLRSVLSAALARAYQLHRQVVSLREHLAAVRGRR